MVARPSDLSQAERTGKYVGSALLIGYLLLYATALLGMNRAWNFEVVEPLLILGILGFGFSLAAWLLTIGTTPLDYKVANPTKELAAQLIYILPLAAYIAWGGSAIRRFVPADPWNAAAILIAKLVFFVIIPAWMMRVSFGYTLRDLAPLSFRRRDMLTFAGMSLLLLGFQAALGRGLRDILQAHLPASKLVIGFPIVFVWLALEAGIVEEFFFRALLQSRLSRLLRSELGGIVLMSLLFGLAHAPGLYLRTGMTQEGLPAHPPLLMAVGYSIVITSVAGFFLGVLWARTRNFALIVLVHAMADLLPNLLPTMHSLQLLR
jgi:membrane protease YdiL (CAAX protease family)